MKKETQMMKKVSVVFCMMIAMVMMMQMPIKAKASKTYLMKSVKVKTVSKAYYFTRTATFKYNKNKNLTQWLESYDGKKAVTLDYAYKYKKGKPTKMTETRTEASDNTKSNRTYAFKKGRIVSQKWPSGQVIKYYYNSHGDVKKSISSYTDNEGNKETNTYKYNYKYYKNGLPKSMKQYFNNKWQYTFNYNKKGLTTKSKSTDGSSKNTYKYNKNGTVKSSVLTEFDKKNEQTLTRTSTFSYTKKQVSKSRYARMINSRGAFSPESFF